ncbi:hypothetical protein CEXT_647781 [Caerostris extrusa]|uniref:Uncharacterized protein n=1 Tax=Caerostris extrusa TaxID=172846 RepID=A0AAV4S1P6_CAEEX|nr:hypothetical protein CEXT_647781 [Caerostris extrusa]
MRQLFLQWIHPAPPNVRRNTLSCGKTKELQQSMLFSENHVKKPVIGLEENHHKQWYRYRRIHPAPPNVRRNTLSCDNSQNWKIVGKENRKKTLLNFSLVSEVQPFNDSLFSFYCRDKRTSTIDALLEKNVKKPDI